MGKAATYKPVRRVRAYDHDRPVFDVIIGEDGMARCDPPDARQDARLDSVTVMDPSTGRTVTRADGARYLFALPYAYSGILFHMGVVEELESGMQKAYAQAQERARS